MKLKVEELQDLMALLAKEGDGSSVEIKQGILRPESLEFHFYDGSSSKVIAILHEESRNLFPEVTRTARLPRSK